MLAEVEQVIAADGQAQPDNAARIERLGTSRTVPRKNYTATRAAKELSELLNSPSYSTKAVEIGGIIQSENGVDIACRESELMLERLRVLSGATTITNIYYIVRKAAGVAAAEDGSHSDSNRLANLHDREGLYWNRRSR